MNLNLSLTLLDVKLVSTMPYDKCKTASSGFWKSPFCYYDIACVACVRGARNARERVTLVIVTLLVRDTREEPGSQVIMDSSSVSHM